jgi:hypothetical protein
MPPTLRSGRQLQCIETQRIASRRTARTASRIAQRTAFLDLPDELITAIYEAAGGGGALLRTCKRLHVLLRETSSMLIKIQPVDRHCRWCSRTRSDSTSTKCPCFCSRPAPRLVDNYGYTNYQRRPGPCVVCKRHMCWTCSTKCRPSKTYMCSAHTDRYTRCYTCGRAWHKTAPRAPTLCAGRCRKFVCDMCSGGRRCGCCLRSLCVMCFGRTGSTMCSGDDAR